LPIYGEGNKKNAFSFYRATGQYYPFDPVRDAPLKLSFDNLKEDCIPAAERMKRMLIEDGFDWYKRYSDLRNLSQDLNRDLPTRQPNDQSVHSIINNANKIPTKAVAAACLAEPERIPQLIENYMDYMWQWGGKAFVEREKVDGKVAKSFDQVLARAREVGCFV